MNTEELQKLSERITLAQAHKTISAMNLIDSFLFDNTLEIEEEAKIVAGNILKAVFFKKFVIRSVTNQKQMQPIDTEYHGIRLDVMITEAGDSSLPIATVYDMEMENRPADKKYLPKRLRFYNGLYDSKILESGEEYDQLPDFVSIVISSYDPFTAGDMYYEVKSALVSHPDIPYENGVTNIFLYCNGKPNFDEPNSKIRLSPEHSKRLQEMLKYIVTGEKPAEGNKDIEEIDSIVTKVKGRKEVTKAYMKQWDRELSIKRETKQEDALEDIRFDRENDIPIEVTRKRLRKSFGYNDATIDELLAKIDAESACVSG